jgi:hypothetical protein
MRQYVYFKYFFRVNVPLMMGQVLFAEYSAELWHNMVDSINSFNGQRMLATNKQRRLK